MKSKIFGFLAGLFLAGGVTYAATFNLFGPVNGVLKGNANSPQTSAAVSSDIRTLWSGTCDATTYLRGDGSCQAPPGTGGGTVNSVGLTAPSIFSVAGSPVTTTGTLAITFATGQTQNRVLASPDGSSGAISLRALVADDLPLVSLTTGVSGILPGANGGTANGFMAFSGPATSLKTFALPNASSTILTTNAAVTVPQGGTGVATLTGIALGNGASPFSAAANANVISLWTGTCDNTTFLRADGACVAVGGALSPANPTASVGLTAVNGASTDYMRADAAPALSQTIIPTWTGLHTFSVSPAVTVASGAQSTTLTASDGLTGSTSRMSLVAGTNFAVISAPSSQASAIVTNGPTGAQGVIRTLGTQPIIFGTNGTYWGDISSTGNLLWAGPYLNLANTAPIEYWSETDGAANNQVWAAQASGEQFSLQACTAIGSGCTKYLTVERTANVLDSIALAATAITLNGVAASDYPQLSVSNIFTGTGNRASTTSPRWVMEETDAPTDEKCSMWYANSSRTELRFNTDATCTSPTGATIPISVTRTGQTIDSIDFTATAVTINGATIIPSVEVSGSFTGTLTGFTASNTGTVNYHKQGSRVTLYVTAAITATSNTTAMTMTGLPVAIRPANACSVIVTSLLSNGNSNFGNADIASNGSVITFAIPTGTGGQTATSGFSNTGTKGLTATFQMTYDVES